MDSKNKPIFMQLNPHFLGFKQDKQINTPNSKK